MGAVPDVMSERWSGRQGVGAKGRGACMVSSYLFSIGLDELGQCVGYRRQAGRLQGGDEDAGGHGQIGRVARRYKATMECSRIKTEGYKSRMEDAKLQ